MRAYFFSIELDRKVRQNSQKITIFLFKSPLLTKGTNGNLSTSECMDRLNECVANCGNYLVATDESVLSLTTGIITCDNRRTGHLASDREYSANIAH